MKKLIIVIVIIVVIIVGGYLIISNIKSSNQANILPNSTTSTSGTNISIKNFAFNPQTLKVKSGTTVTWINNDSVSHTVTSDTDGVLNSPILAPGQSFTFTFNSTGTTNYHCNIHKTMQGTIIVE